MDVKKNSCLWGRESPGTNYLDSLVSAKGYCNLVYLMSRVDCLFGGFTTQHSNPIGSMWYSGIFFCNIYVIYIYNIYMVDSSLVNYKINIPWSHGSYGNSLHVYCVQLPRPILGCPRKLGSMVSKWVIFIFQEWG